jgi:hypothetical protein
MSNRLVKTPDTAYIASSSKDGYGDVTVLEENEVKCAFFNQFSQQQAGNQELTQSDAYAYLDVDNDFIKNLGYQLQGMYLKTNVFGVDQWFIITTVEVAQRKLLTNQVNNVLVNLQVAAKPTGAQ